MNLFHGDSLHKLKELPENSIDAIVTDPPYGLSFMGKKWDYDVPSVELWREVFRVLKPGGHVLSFGGTRTYHRMVVNMEDAGFEIRDQVQWLYGSGFPKSHNISKSIDKWDGWGTALKPANEPICLARKPLEKGLTVAENVLKFGTGAINVDGSRIATQDNLGRPVLQTQSWKNTSTAGVGSVSDDWKKGRWPANVLFDECAAEMLDQQSGTLKPPGSNNKKKFIADDASIFGIGTGEHNRSTYYPDAPSGASRFFYVAKASKRERNAGLEGMPTKPMNTYNFSEDGSFTKNSTAKTGEQIRENRQNHHPTVKPIKLMEYLIKLITPPNGTVLDPFMGSGSTGVAAKNLGFEFIGIELNSEYYEIAKRRINGDKCQIQLKL